MESFVARILANYLPQFRGVKKGGKIIKKSIDLQNVSPYSLRHI